MDFNLITVWRQWNIANSQQTIAITTQISMRQNGSLNSDQLAN